MSPLLLLLLLNPSFADEEDSSEESEETTPIVLDLGDALVLPSALDRVDGSAEELSEEPSPELQDLVDAVPELAPMAEGSGDLVRGRFGVRPRLAWSGRLGAPGGGMRGGLVLRHQWWSLLPLGPQWVGESALSASLAFAGSRGPALSLQSLAGAWAGPVALTLGPRVAWDRVSFAKGEDLAAGLVLGPLVSLGAEAGPVALQLGGGPCWLLAGERGAADLPLGDEWLGQAGVGVALGMFRWTVRGQVRETQAGTLLDVSLGLNLSLGE